MQAQLIETRSTHPFQNWPTNRGTHTWHDKSGKSFKNRQNPERTNKDKSCDARVSHKTWNSRNMAFFNPPPAPISKRRFSEGKFAKCKPEFRTTKQVGSETAGRLLTLPANVGTFFWFILFFSDLLVCTLYLETCFIWKLRFKTHFKNRVFEHWFSENTDNWCRVGNVHVTKNAVLLTIGDLIFRKHSFSAGNGI